MSPQVIMEEELKRWELGDVSPGDYGVLYLGKCVCPIFYGKQVTAGGLCYTADVWQIVVHFS